MFDQGKRINGARTGVDGARTPASGLRQKHATQMAELMAILRVYQRVVENNLKRLDGAAHLAAGDARRRLAEFCERTDEERRKRKWQQH